jgi:dihydrofolate synthase/folylpolyglutamate synthase
MNSIQYLLSIETRGIKLGLKRTHEIMDACKNPHIGLPSIQVAGTNGKGSVCAMLSNILKAAGYKTGLFTSPHLVTVNERIRINGSPISNKEIDLFIQTYKKSIEKIEVTFFETITAMALWYFNKEDVDICVLETGLGGRLDSVSICEPMVTVITPISLDHMEILGETLPEIAFEKAGIIKNGVTCISSQQDSSATKVLLEEANKKGSPIHFINSKNILEYIVNIPGEVQKENAKLAVLTLEYLNNFNIPKTAVINGLQTVQWFGRNQLIQKNPPVIFDVAHNIESMCSFIKYYNSLNVSEDSFLIIALQERKQVQALFSIFQIMFKYIICTETAGPHSMPAKVLRKYFDVDHHVEIIKNPLKAIQFGWEKLSLNDGMAIIGSHYLGPAVSKVFKIYFDKC